MGRTIHYKTKGAISKKKFGRLQELLEEIKNRKSIQPEKLKFWRGGKHVEDAQVWGFTKVKSQERAELVIESIKELSSQAPEITWVIFDEGKTKPIKIYTKNGMPLTPD